DRLERAEPVEEPRRLRAQVLAADLRARKARAIDEPHRQALLGEEDGGRRAGRTGADDDDVGRHENTASMRPSTGYSWIVSPRAARARRAGRARRGGGGGGPGGGEEGGGGGGGAPQATRGGEKPAGAGGRSRRGRSGGPPSSGGGPPLPARARGDEASGCWRRC